MTTTRQDTPTTKLPHFATLLVMALDPKEIGERISKRRKELGWTHQRLADVMNVELRTAQRWQEGIDAQGKSLLPRLHTLMDLAEKMKVERSYFVEGQAAPDTQPGLLERCCGRSGATRAVIGRCAWASRRSSRASRTNRSRCVASRRDAPRSALRFGPDDEPATDAFSSLPSSTAIL